MILYAIRNVSKLKHMCIYVCWWWSDVTVICGHNTISMLSTGATRRTVWSSVVMICRIIRIKLNQLVGEKVHIITILLRKWCHN